MIDEFYVLGNIRNYNICYNILYALKTNYTLFHFFLFSGLSEKKHI